MIMSIFLSIFIVFEIYFGWLAASSAMNETHFNHKILIFVGFIIEMSEGIYRIQYWKEWQNDLDNKKTISPELLQHPLFEQMNIMVEGESMMAQIPDIDHILNATISSEL